MLRGMKKTRSVSVSRYEARLIDINEYLASFPEANFTDKISVTKLYDILPNNMHTSWSKQAYVQGFHYEPITFKKAVNMYEHMEIAKSIY